MNQDKTKQSISGGESPRENGASGPTLKYREKYRD